MSNSVVIGPLPSPWRQLGWKEARQLFPIGIILFSLMLFTLSVMFYLTENTNRDPSWFANFAALFSCMFGLASGILMFVQEREQGTDQLLANLPITSCWTIYVKFSIGLIAVGLFVSVSLTLAYVIATLGAPHNIDALEPKSDPLVYTIPRN